MYLSLPFIIANIIGYVFHAVVSRRLGPPLYAEYSILYGLMIALSRPLWTLSSAITRVAVSGRAAGHEFDQVQGFSLRVGVITSIIIGACVIALSPVLRGFLKVNSLLSFIFIGATLSIWSLCGVLRGLFASVELFSIISYTSIVELLVRAVAGIALVIMGFKITGALSGSLLGAMVLLSYLWQNKDRVQKLYEERLGGRKVLDKFRWIIAKVFFISIPVAFFFELDLLLIKRAFPAEEAGIYAASALMGKSLLMFSALAAAAIYPRLIEQRLNKGGFITFLWGLGITVFLFAAGYVLLKFFGRPFINLLFGDKYGGVVELVPRYILAIVPLAFHIQVTNYKSAVGGWVEGFWLWLILGAYLLSLEYSSAGLDLYLQTIFIFHLVTAPLSFVVLYICRNWIGKE